MKKICFYLPQYHPISENDDFWGKGFTEWHNVAKAKPLFEGHYQPHIPADLGFYDLRLSESRIQQEKLASKYGIDGFCYYHYWFNGKRLLNLPLDKKMEDKNQFLPFMICWANENWTRTWDGLENEILIKQNYSEEDDYAHIEHLLKYLKDDRYIEYNGKKLIAIYKSWLIPNPKSTIEIWRKVAKENNIDLFICKMDAFNHEGEKHLKDGFDAAIEFAPFSGKLYDFLDYNWRTKIKKQVYLKIKLKFFSLLGMSSHFDNVIEEYKLSNSSQIDYNEYVDFIIHNSAKYQKNYLCFPGVTPSWDNTARKGVNSFLFKNSTPNKFAEWISHIYSVQKTKNPDSILFINAWNEWGEGNHLEPCKKWGLSYLEMLYEATNGK